MILTSIMGDNSDLIKRAADFYIKDGMTVADVTFGKGVFWKKVDTSRFTLAATDLQSGTCFGDLPYHDSTIDILILDPPYMHGGATIKKSLNDCYKNESTSHEAVVRLYAKGMLEAARVLKQKGQLWVKTQDEIESNKQRMTSHEVTTLAQTFGFSVKDLFILTQKSIPLARYKGKAQKTARKNHSYLFIYEFRR